MRAWTATLLLVISGCSGGQQEMPADLILQGGKVYTGEGWAETVAVREGRVLAVGGADIARRFRGAETELIELDGATLFPGLNDSHAHPLFAAREQFQPCRIPPEPASAVLETMAACVKNAPDRNFIYTGPVSTQITGQITRRELDVVAGDHPVGIYAVGSHAVILNSAALKAAGVDRSTVAPSGGEIRRDASGEPTGLLLDAWSLLPAGGPPPDPKLVAVAARWALDRMVEVGITSFTDANAGPVEMRAYADLAQAGQLEPRVRACRSWDARMPLDEILGASVPTDAQLRADCVKVFLDGETSTGFTGALIEPYLGGGTGEPLRGELAIPPDALKTAVARFDAAGLTVKIHSWGDAAFDAAVSAIEAARAANGSSGARHEIGHVALARADDLARAKAVNAVIEFSPWLWFPPAGEFMFRNIGAQRMARAWPVRDALDLGADVIGGTDWATAPGRSPWAAIETLVTRLEPAQIDSPAYRFGPTTVGRGEPFAPGQRITLEEAVALFTSNPARASDRADAPGIIEPGRLADLLVLDRDPFSIPIAEVHAIRPAIVIVGGKVVHRREEVARTADPLRNR